MARPYLDDPEVQRMRKSNPAAFAELERVLGSPDHPLREIPVGDLDRLEQKQARGLNTAARFPLLRQRQEPQRRHRPCAEREAYWRLWCRRGEWRPGVLERKQENRGAFVIEWPGVDGNVQLGPRRMVLALLLDAPPGRLSTTSYIAKRLGIELWKARDLRDEVRRLALAPPNLDVLEALPIPSGTFDRTIHDASGLGEWRVRGHYEASVPGAASHRFVVDEHQDHCECGCGEPVPVGRKFPAGTKVEQAAHRMRAQRKKVKATAALREARP
jgi:hypothetical protein